MEVRVFSTAPPLRSRPSPVDAVVHLLFSAINLTAIKIPEVWQLSSMFVFSGLQIM
mgnify:CR=1 FL=1